MSFPRMTGIALIATTLLSACGGGDGSGPIFDPFEQTPASVTAVAGNNQSGTVGQTLAQPLRVRVLNASGRAVANEPVEFVVTAGGGSLSAAVAGGLAADLPALQTSVVVDVNTDASGEAQVSWMMGTSVGTQGATATVRTLTPAQFTATAEAGPPASLTLEGGDDQLQVIGVPLDEAFAVGVADAYGNPVSGAPVAWEITAGNGELIEVSPATNAGGLSFATLVPGPIAEPVDVTATLSGLAPVTFVALGFAGLLDPVPDEFSTAASDGLVPPEVDAIFAWREGDLLVVLMLFAQEVVPDDIGGPNTVLGMLEFDTDQNPATGGVPLTDQSRPPAPSGSTGMGRDYFVVMSATATPTEYEVWQEGVDPTGTITPIFDFDLVTFEIPAALLGGDDLALNMALIVGTDPEPTDIAPNDGYLSTSVAPALLMASPGNAMRDRVKRGRVLLETARLRAVVSTGGTAVQARRPWER